MMRILTLILDYFAGKFFSRNSQETSLALLGSLLMLRRLYVVLLVSLASSILGIVAFVMLLQSLTELWQEGQALVFSPVMQVLFGVSALAVFLSFLMLRKKTWIGAWEEKHQFEVDTNQSSAGLSLAELLSVLMDALQTKAQSAGTSEERSSSEVSDPMQAPYSPITTPASEATIN